MPGGGVSHTSIHQTHSSKSAPLTSWGSMVGDPLILIPSPISHGIGRLARHGLARARLGGCGEDRGGLWPDLMPVLECEITEGAPSGSPSYIALLFRLPFPFEWGSPFGDPILLKFKIKRCLIVMCQIVKWVLISNQASTGNLRSSSSWDEKCAIV